MKKLLYFGCVDYAGHHLSESEYSAMKSTGLPKDFLGHLDATFCPPQWKPGYLVWTCQLCQVVAWWDTTGDSRPGSNSVLVGVGYIDAEDMINDAYHQFPKIMNRQPRPKPYQP